MEPFGDMMTQNDVATGNWPPGVGTMKDQYDQLFGIILDPNSANIQAEPQNQWKLHPLLDGCVGKTPYPDSPESTI